MMKSTLCCNTLGRRIVTTIVLLSIATIGFLMYQLAGLELQIVSHFDVTLRTARRDGSALRETRVSLRGGAQVGFGDELPPSVLPPLNSHNSTVRGLPSGASAIAAPLTASDMAKVRKVGEYLLRKKQSAGLLPSSGAAAGSPLVVKSEERIARVSLNINSAGHRK